MTEDSSHQPTEAVGELGEQPPSHAGYDRYRSLANSNLIIFVPNGAIPPFRFKAGGWQLLQSSVELNPAAEARIAEQGYLIETKSLTSSGELTTSHENDLETPSLEVEFALVIARMIDTVERNPEDMRKLIYDLARYKLEEQLLHAKPEERRHTQSALEVAIRGVEIFTEKRAPILAPMHQSQLNGSDSASTDSKPPLAPGLVREVGPHLRSDLQRKAGRAVHKSNPWSYLTRTAAMIAIMVASLIVFQHREGLLSFTGNLSKQDPEVAIEERSAPSQVSAVLGSAPPREPEMLLPTDYGVYAIRNEAPVDLTRIGVTTVLTTPSLMVLPDGHPKFIVFSRDLAATIGDRAQVRILAKVGREFSPSVAGKKPAEDAWVIRNISFPFRASPVKDHPEMTMLHSEDPGLELTPGRYALVLKTQAYDFTIEGKVSDPRHCIERIVGPVGIAYSSCKNLTDP